MEIFTGFFTNPYAMGAMITLVVCLYFLKGGEMIPAPRKDNESLERDR